VMVVVKLAPALATGNAVVLEPSELPPFTTLFIANLLNEVSVPPGVINIVNGYGSIVGSTIPLHTDMDKVAFTGSTITGRKILAAAAEFNLKAVTLELGGKSPTIVFDDTDLEQAIKWGGHSIFVNMGHICIAGSRIYVQEGIFDKFIECLTQYVQAFTDAVGSPFEEGNLHGLQISKTQYERVMGYIESGKSDGDKVHAGGEGIGKEGYFIKSTMFVDTTPDMKIMREEIFGPVCAVVKFKTEDGVIELANDTTFGLAANLFTENSARAIRISNALEAGCVNVNCSLQFDANVPFGGYKQSGIGREAREAALDACTQVKAVHINLGQRLNNRNALLFDLMAGPVLHVTNMIVFTANMIPAANSIISYDSDVRRDDSREGDGKAREHR
ncbi:Aldehyde dehydrogenase, partial [Leucoagaricus sp. SymC.cos]